MDRKQVLTYVRPSRLLPIPKHEITLLHLIAVKKFVAAVILQVVLEPVFVFSLE